MSQFVPEPNNFEEVAILPVEVKNTWLKETFKHIKKLINNPTFLVEDPGKRDPVTPFMDIYKARIRSDGILYKLSSIIEVRGDLQTK